MSHKVIAPGYKRKQPIDLTASNKRKKVGYCPPVPKLETFIMKMPTSGTYLSWLPIPILRIIESMATYMQHQQSMDFLQNHRIVYVTSWYHCFLTPPKNSAYCVHIIKRNSDMTVKMQFNKADAIFEHREHLGGPEFRKSLLEQKILIDWGDIIPVENNQLIENKTRGLICSINKKPDGI